MRTTLFIIYTMKMSGGIIILKKFFLRISGRDFFSNVLSLPEDHSYKEAERQKSHKAHCLILIKYILRSEQIWITQTLKMLRS